MLHIEIKYNSAAFTIFMSFSQYLDYVSAFLHCKPTVDMKFKISGECTIFGLDSEKKIAEVELLEKNIYKFNIGKKLTPYLRN